ncbi:hypothetical protein DMA11_03930 [Marinilabiliaceae bacterium JC017]|nr:hypothetical protein DMA11_03930 [Marinilabiliaceae bacterium JC017]
MRASIIYLAIALFCICSPDGYSQDSSNEGLPDKKFHFGFIYPVTSDGWASRQYCYNFSFSMIESQVGGVHGFALAPLTNIFHGPSNGCVISGVGTYAKDSFKGVEVGPLFNINRGDMNGVAFSGVFNSVKGSMKGLQFGVVNQAQSLSGVQFGVLNICDSVSGGVPIGLINIVKNGYLKFEFLFEETLNNTVNMKLGTPQFYTIFAGGVHYASAKAYVASGMGFGRIVHDSARSSASLDLLCYSIYSHMDEDQLNLLNQLRLTFTTRLSDGLKLVWGPSVNVMYSKNKEGKDLDLATEMVPYHLWRKQGDNWDLKMWPGVVAGIRF